MTATIHYPFKAQEDKPVDPDHQVDLLGRELPSLEEMHAVLKANFSVLDEDDRNAYSLISHVNKMGLNAKLEAHMGARANAWSMLNRYGVNL